METFQKSHLRKSSGKGKGKEKPHGSKLQESVGNISKGENNGALIKYAQASKSKSNNGLGLVRSSRDEGLEQHFSFNAREQEERVPPPNRPSLDGVGVPLVDIPIRHTNKSRSNDLQLENSIFAIAGAKLERIRSGGRARGKENLDLQISGCELLGKQDIQKTTPSEPADAWLQPASQLQGNPVRDIATHDYHCGRGVSLQEDDEGVGMELVEPNGCSESS